MQQNVMSNAVIHKVLLILRASYELPIAVLAVLVFNYIAYLFCGRTLLSQGSCRGQRTTWESLLFPVTLWVLEIELRSLGLAARAFVHWAISLALCYTLAQLEAQRCLHQPQHKCVGCVCALTSLGNDVNWSHVIDSSESSWTSGECIISDWTKKKSLCRTPPYQSISAIYSQGTNAHKLSSLKHSAIISGSET